MRLDAFEFYDGWLLLSIGNAKKGSTLEEIISTGDHMNHAVFTIDELNYGMTKLIVNEYVVKKNNRFIWSEKAKMFYKTNRKLFEGCIEQLIRMSETLIKTQAKKDCVLVQYFTQNDLDAAYNL